ncbi:MAG: hypothetical protein Q8K86_09065 [Candidatus Nanopelagicaceae bacterium]|nr:hypothetical protein [Candidatus Nanopelagicaceae bacterium]
MTVECLNLIRISIENEEMDARPSEWEYDNKGEPVRALEFRTTCSKCAQLIVFRASEISLGHVACKACGFGHKKYEELQKVEAAQALKKPVAVPGTVPGTVPEPLKSRSLFFVEPISAGLMEHP